MTQGNNKVVDVIIYIFLACVALTCLIPIIHTVAISFSGKSAADAGQVFLTPIDFSISSYQKILEDKVFFNSFGVSIKRVLIGGLLNFALTILMAYPLSKSNKVFPGRNIYMWFVIFTMLFSGGLIPWYMTINKLGMLDTIWALVLPTAVPVFNVILLMNFFRGIPKELEEAAYMDGAGAWQILIKIFIPISTPAIATVTLFSVVSHWNSFFDGMILMNKMENWPLQTYIQQLVVSLDSLMNTNDPEELKRLMAVSNKTLNAAKVIISMIPILIIYPFLQRYFVKGIVIGSIKG